MYIAICKECKSEVYYSGIKQLLESKQAIFEKFEEKVNQKRVVLECSSNAKHRNSYFFPKDFKNANDGQ